MPRKSWQPFTSAPQRTSQLQANRARFRIQTRRESFDHRSAPEFGRIHWHWTNEVWHGPEEFAKAQKPSGKCGARTTRPDCPGDCQVGNKLLEKAGAYSKVLCQACEGLVKCRKTDYFTGCYWFVVQWSGYHLQYFQVRDCEIDFKWLMVSRNYLSHVAFFLVKIFLVKFKPIFLTFSEII